MFWLLRDIPLFVPPREICLVSNVDCQLLAPMSRETSRRSRSMSLSAASRSSHLHQDSRSDIPTPFFMITCKKNQFISIKSSSLTNYAPKIEILHPFSTLNIFYPFKKLQGNQSHFSKSDSLQQRYFSSQDPQKWHGHVYCRAVAASRGKSNLSRSERVEMYRFCR